MRREVLKSRAISRMVRVAGLAGMVVATSALVAGCDEAEPPTSPGAVTPPLVVESFAGTIVSGGTAFYSFNVPVSGPVSLTLLQYRSQDTGQDTDKVANLGIGVPAGTTCLVASGVTTKAGNSPQFSQTVPPSIYCVRITDPGQLEGAATFLINIAHPK
jgi:hypothetical protein